MMFSMMMDWISEAKRLFNAEKPEHFTDFTHCEECAEHDAALRMSSVEKIGLDVLGNPGWDPMCFCNEQGKKYYMPALVRLSLESIHDEFYLEQFLFHLEYDGEDNSFLKSCNDKQKNFIEYIIDTYYEVIEENLVDDDVLKVYHLWSRR